MTDTDMLYMASLEKKNNDLEAKVALIGEDTNVPASAGDTNVGHKSGGWISVKDRLPEDTEPCAVVTENNGLGVSRLMGRNELEWTLLGEPVLYWMPIPEPPKEGDTNG